MNELNRESLGDLKEELRGTSNTKLVAAKTDKVWILSNGAWLMEWPEDLVEECLPLYRLVSRGKPKSHGKGGSEIDLANKLLRNNWREVILPKGSSFDECSTSGPTPQELRHFGEECLMVNYHGTRQAFNPCFIDASKMFLKDVYPLMVTENKIMGFFDGSRLVGVCIGKH